MVFDAVRHRLIWGTLLLVVALLASALHEVHAADYFKITSVSVEGTFRIEAGTVEISAKKAGLEPGAYLSPKLSKDAIDKIFAIGAFEDVAIYTQNDPSCSGCVKVLIKVKELPAIREIRYEGLDELSEDDVKEVMDIKPNEVVDELKIRRVEEKILNLYKEKGYNLARVSHRLEPVGSNNEVDLVFVMNERGKIYVKEVIIIGNQKVPDSELKQNLVLQEGNSFTWMTDFGILRQQYLEHDLFMIEKYYYDHGFVKAKVERPQIYISPDERFLTIVFHVTEGKQYKLGKVYFTGEMICKDDFPKDLPCTTETSKEDLVFSVEDLKKRMRQKQGDIFNRTMFTEDLQKMSDMFMDRGYAYANLTPMPVFDEEKNTISLVIQMQRGPLVHIERIEIVGNTKTRDKVIRREIVISEGDLFSSTAIKVSKARIYRLGFFESVEIQTERGSREDRIVLRVEIKEKSTGTFNLGFGFSSIENFLFQAQIAQQNFLGRGQSLSLMALFSGQRRQFMLRFYEPYLFDTRTTFSISLYNQQLFYPSQTSFGSFSKTSQGGEIRLGYPVWRDLYLIGGYKLSYENIDISNRFHAHLFKNGITSAVLGSIMYDTRDNRLYPSKGQFHSLSMQYADGWSASELEFAKFTLVDRFFIPVWWKLVLKFNFEWGWVFSLEEKPDVNSPSGDRDIPIVPISERYLLGGIYSIRGYGFGSISPSIKVILQDDPGRYPSDYRIGGVKQFVSNIELEIPIIEKAGLKWIFFFDAGNTWAENEQWFYLGQPSKNEYDLPLGIYYSWGFGFRWYSPMGPLRFEWGIPLTPRPEDDPISFEFSVGSPF